MWGMEAAWGLLCAVYNVVRGSWLLSLVWTPSPHALSPSTSTTLLQAIHTLQTLRPHTDKKQEDDEARWRDGRDREAGHSHREAGQEDGETGQEDREVGQKDEETGQWEEVQWEREGWPVEGEGADTEEVQSSRDMVGGDELSGRGDVSSDGGSQLREGGSQLREGGSQLREGGSQLREGGSQLREGGGVPSDGAEEPGNSTCRQKVEEVLSLIRSLPPDRNLLEVVSEEDGYNLLQHAVLAGQVAVVEAVLQRCGLGRPPPCSPPAHLAALLGHTRILQLLLEAGASVTAKRGMCFPRPHRALGQRSALLGLARRPRFPCSSQRGSQGRRTPLQCAISGDQVQCLQLLLGLESGGQAAPISTPVPAECRRRSNSFCLDLLHLACQQGATRCLAYLVRTFPEIVNTYNAAGDTPLLTAVPWGWECVKILVDSGADVHCRSHTLGETALHRLYRMNMDGLFSIFDTTQFLLTTGIEQDINALTSLQESPLHMLVSHISYAGGNFVDPVRRTVPRSSLQKDYQKQVVRALRAILEFNADPHLLNGAGLQALSRMLHIALKACHPEDPSVCVQSSQPDRFIVEYRNNYSALEQALQVLLQHRANVNFRCQAGHTPVMLLLQCCLHDSAASLCRQRLGLLAALQTLLSHGADLSFVGGNDSTCATLVAVICQRYFTENMEPALRTEFVELCNDILTLLLRSGMNPNYTSARSAPLLRGGNGNALVEFVRLAGLAQERRDFGALLRWLRTLLQWGADPNLEPFPCEPVICHSQSSIFLKKQGTQPLGHLIRKVPEREAAFVEGGGAQDLLCLFYNAMEHRPLYQALAAAAKSVAPRWPPQSGGDGGFLELVAELGRNPRSLRQIARVAVYCALQQRCLALHVDKLPLPAALKSYLLEIS